MRYTLAIVAVVVAWSAASYIYQRNVTNYGTVCATSLRPDQRCPSEYMLPRALTVTRPTWEDPTAILIALGGLAVVLRIVWTFTDRRSLDEFIG